MTCARLRKHMGNPRDKHLSEGLEALKERHERGLLNSVEFQHFWESVKTSFAETQVIIIENSHQLPGDGTLSDANVVLFTGNDQGRRGFIPQAAGVA